MNSTIEVNIEGFNGRYTVSTDGTIRSYPKTREPKVIGSENSNGYMSITLRGDGNNRKTTVHRIVAEHFIDNPEGKKCVDHIDGNKLNNNINNLRWCTDSENQDFRVYQGNCGKEHGHKGINNSPQKLEWNGRVFNSKNHMAKELSADRGVTQKCLVKTISNVIKRDGTLYGYNISVID